MPKGKRARKRYRVRLDSHACIGCLACTRCKGIEAGDDMKAHAVKTEIDDDGCWESAAKRCPVGAITLTGR